MFVHLSPLVQLERADWTWEGWRWDQAVTYVWNDKPSHSEGTPLITQIVLQCFRVAKANVTSIQSGLSLNGHRCLSRGPLAISKVTHSLVNSVLFKVNSPRGDKGGLPTKLRCQHMGGKQEIQNLINRPSCFSHCPSRPSGSAIASVANS